MSDEYRNIRITLDLTAEEARDFAQAIKRICRNNLREPMTISTPSEERNADHIFRMLRDELASHGIAPR